MFKSISDIIFSGIYGNKIVSGESNKVLKNTRLEGLIYKDARKGHEDEFSGIEQSGTGKLSSFGSLSQDMFDAMYRIRTDFKDDDELSTTAKKFNKYILEKTMDAEEYPTLKMLTEGNETQSIEAALEFMSTVLNNLDDMLKDISGEKGTLNVIERMEKQVDKLQDELSELLEQHASLQSAGADGEGARQLEAKAVKAANTIQSKQQQLEKLNEMVTANTVKHKAELEKAVASALKQSIQKAEETTDILNAWGNGAGNGSMQNDRELVECVRQSEKLREISRLLGKYRQVAARLKKNAFVYGRGSKYDIEFGNDIGRVLAAEFLSLANPATTPLFIKKYKNRTLKQYRRREHIRKGRGSLILCLDESGSTKGGKEYWGKALALTLLELTIKAGKNFALVHFDENVLVHEADRCNYTPETLFAMAESFLGGGTSFENPLREASQLLAQEKYKDAGIVFITDGECSIRDEFYRECLRVKPMADTEITGILLDRGSGSVSDVTFRTFCKEIHRTSQLVEDKIVEKLIADRI